MKCIQALSSSLEELKCFLLIKAHYTKSLLLYPKLSISTKLTFFKSSKIDCKFRANLVKNVFKIFDQILLR